MFYFILTLLLSIKVATGADELFTEAREAYNETDVVKELYSLFDLLSYSSEETSEESVDGYEGPFDLDKLLKSISAKNHSKKPSTSYVHAKNDEKMLRPMKNYTQELSELINELFTYEVPLSKTTDQPDSTEKLRSYIGSISSLPSAIHYNSNRSEITSIPASQEDIFSVLDISEKDLKDLESLSSALEVKSNATEDNLSEELFELFKDLSSYLNDSHSSTSMGSEYKKIQRRNFDIDKFSKRDESANLFNEEYASSHEHNYPLKSKFFSDNIIHKNLKSVFSSKPPKTESSETVQFNNSLNSNTFKRLLKSTKYLTKYSTLRNLNEVEANQNTEIKPLNQNDYKNGGKFENLRIVKLPQFFPSTSSSQNECSGRLSTYNNCKTSSIKKKFFFYDYPKDYIRGKRFSTSSFVSPGVRYDFENNSKMSANIQNTLLAPERKVVSLRRPKSFMFLLSNRTNTAAIRELQDVMKEKHAGKEILYFSNLPFNNNNYTRDILFNNSSVKIKRQNPNELPHSIRRNKHRNLKIFRKRPIGPKNTKLRNPRPKVSENKIKNLLTEKEMTKNVVSLQNPGYKNIDSAGTFHRKRPKDITASRNSNYNATKTSKLMLNGISVFIDKSIRKRNQRRNSKYRNKANNVTWAINQGHTEMNGIKSVLKRRPKSAQGIEEVQTLVSNNFKQGLPFQRFQDASHPLHMGTQFVVDLIHDPQSLHQITITAKSTPQMHEKSVQFKARRKNDDEASKIYEQTIENQSYNSKRNVEEEAIEDINTHYIGSTNAGRNRSFMSARSSSNGISSHKDHRKKASHPLRKGRNTVGRDTQGHLKQKISVGSRRKKISNAMVRSFMRRYVFNSKIR